MTTQTNLLRFLELCGKLKHLKRTGWVRTGVQDPETVASHMWRMGIMIMSMDTKDLGTLDRQKCIRMAIVHDLAECIVGDITPHDNVTAEQKHDKEKAAMDDVCGLLGDEQKRELIELWEEYEQQVTEEATFVRDMDKLDMVIQANEYEGDQPTLNLSQFFESTEGQFKHKAVVQLDTDLRAERALRKSKPPSTEPDVSWSWI